MGGRSQRSSIIVMTVESAGIYDILLGVYNAFNVRKWNGIMPQLCIALIPV